MQTALLREVHDGDFTLEMPEAGRPQGNLFYEHYVRVSPNDEELIVTYCIGTEPEYKNYTDDERMLIYNNISTWSSLSTNYILVLFLLLTLWFCVGVPIYDFLQNQIF